MTGCALVMLAGQGCPCPKSPTDTGSAVAPIGGPIPGPIIDTTVGDTADLTYRYDEAVVPATAGDVKVIDPRFITKHVAAVLIDTKGATNGKKTVFGLAKGTVLKVTFSDGAWYTVKIGNSGTELEWTCSSAGGSTNVVLTAGSSGQIPDCIATVGGRTVTSFATTSLSSKKGDILVIKKP
jgi:hypothetical protein